jgi:hypothetical protein
MEYLRAVATQMTDDSTPGSASFLACGFAWTYCGSAIIFGVITAGIAFCI